MLTLIRHAQSAANAGSATFHPATIPLTTVGHSQAEQFSRSTVASPVGAIWSSPFLRAVQTAKPTAERCRVRIQEAPIHEFTYLCPARCAGTTATERMRWVCEYWERGDPNYIDGPGAESFAMFIGRARDALSIFSKYSLPIQAVAFSHGQFLQMIYWLNGYRDEPASEAGMREFRALDRMSPIHHCEGLQLCPASPGTIVRWPSSAG